MPAPAGCNAITVCGAKRTVLDGVMAPACEQFSEQHSRAAATTGVSLCMSAALQQSMPSMVMLQPRSPERRGIPADALTKSSSNSAKDASRFFISIGTLLKVLIGVNLRGRINLRIRVFNEPSSNIRAQRFQPVFAGLLV